MHESPVAVVTGAGSGIGRATCNLLIQAGYAVALVGRNEANLKRTVEMATADSAVRESRTLIVLADVGQPGDAASVIDRVLKQWGRIDVLINNAAVIAVLPIEQTSHAALLRLFATNAFGPAHLVARAWLAMLRQADESTGKVGGRIVNVSSMSSIDPFPGLSMYAASKAALESLTRSIHVEGFSQGIRAFTIVPGSVETAMLRQVASEQDLPRERVLDPMDVARIIADCATGRRDEDAGKAIVVPSP